jgi:cytochrome P450
MTLRFGEVPALVASSMEAAQAILKVNDTRFADRFAPATSATITYGATNLILSPYGERWRQLRKIVVQEMLTTTRVQSFKHIRQEEVARFLQGMAAAAANGTAVDFSTAVSKLVNDTFLRECVGSRCKYQDEFLDAVHTASQLASGITIADLYPSSRIMQMLGTAPRKGLACRQRIDRILRQIIQEAKEAMECDDKTAHESFVSLLLRLQKDGSMPIPLTNETIIALMFVSFIYHSIATFPSSSSRN